MKAEWLIILQHATEDSGLVHLRLGTGKGEDLDWHGVALAELIAYGYLEPLPEQGDQPDMLSYRITRKGRQAVAERRDVPSRPSLHAPP